MPNVEIDQLRERLSQRQITIGFIGAIGAGKSSLAERISERLGIGIVAESFQENPYLENFYSDPRTWSFRSQVWFLQDAVGQASKIKNIGAAVFDPKFDMHTDVFARVQCEVMGWMDKRAYQTYVQLKEILLQEYPLREPDLTILVDAPFKVLAKRIRKRGRPYELRMLEHFPQYLMAIQGYVRVWRREHPHANVVTINTNNTDISNEASFEEVELQILKALLAKKS